MTVDARNDAEATLDALTPAHSLLKQRGVTAEGGDPQVAPQAASPEGVPSEDQYPRGLVLLFILLSLVLSIVIVAVDQVRRWISFPPLPPTRRPPAADPRSRPSLQRPSL